MIGVWRSLGARLIWDQEVGGSNPLIPTTRKGINNANDNKRSSEKA